MNKEKLEVLDEKSEDIAARLVMWADHVLNAISSESTAKKISLAIQVETIEAVLKVFDSVNQYRDETRYNLRERHKRRDDEATT